jgi:hypothetical protein
MIPAVIRQASAFVLARPQPEYRRFLHDRIDFADPLIGIRGPRGSGKTTIMLQHAQSAPLPPDKIIYVSCDHPAMVGVKLHDLAQVFFQEGGRLLLIDEIHRRRGCGTELKTIRDTFDLQVVFSGSSALRLDHELADLSRRAVVYELPVLSLREFIEMETDIRIEPRSLEGIVSGHREIAARISTRLRPIEMFQRYLRCGAYPFFRESHQSYGRKLLEVINITIDSDLSGIFNIEPRMLDKLKKILYMLCCTPPVELNKSKLAGAVGTSWPTLSNYLERLQAGGLIRMLRGGRGMRAINKPGKLLLDNPNLFHVLCAAPDIGALREAFFVSQLSLNHQVHCHDRGDFMVDDRFVFEIGGAGKKAHQIDGQADAYVVADDIECGEPGRIPLWIFGMEY